ncbi:hypothetical protein C8Q80DRAFT_189444 [Daedaleopsis nitida]|nr:hypothetical protein C8Q80DRAFT_189444 [Daedaleopsis nitida]
MQQCDERLNRLLHFQKQQKSSVTQRSDTATQSDLQAGKALARSLRLRRGPAEVGSLDLQAPAERPPQARNCFTDLPPEIFFEMARHMHPLSLLQLARTSRLLRDALLTIDSRNFWDRALKSVPALPFCPDDMSLPFYVALIFDEHCMACGEGESYLIDYSLGVRLCDTCFAKEVAQGSVLFGGVPDAVRDVVLMLVPSEQTIDIE